MKRRGNWFWGTFLLVVGVLLVVGQVVGFAQFGFWHIALGILLLACLIQSLVSRSFVGITLSLALLYVVFQTPLGLFHISPWLLILAAFLVGGGLSMIFRRKPAAGGVYWGSYHNQGDGHIPPGEAAPSDGGPGPEQQSYSTHPHVGVYNAERPVTEEANNDDNFPYGKVSFGASTRYLHSTALEAGRFEVSCGAMEVYFDQATLSPNGARIELDVSLGAATLFIPRNWNVLENLNTSLAGVDNENRYAQPDRTLPPLELVGNVNLGGIEIKYI